MSNAVVDYQIIDKLSDPRYFIETFFWIIDKNRQRVPFLLNPPQVKYLENRTHHDLILKARKEGISSLLRALWLHACFFTDNVRAVILSHDLDSTMRHFDAVRWTLDNMGYDGMKLVVDLDKESQKQLVFPQTNSSFWIGTAGSRAFGRGDDITHLHLSEVAHYQDQSVLTSVLEACVPNAWKVMETTANGVGEAFYDLWKEAKDPQSGSPWKPHFFPWFQDPTNSTPIPEGVAIRLTDQETRMKNQYNLSISQVYWYRNKRAAMADKSLMPQEHPANDQEAFLSSGRHAFNLQKLQEKKLKYQLPLHIGDIVDDGKEITLRANPEGQLRVWKMPRQGRGYLIDGDVGEGLAGGDYSRMDVIDRASWEQVATWRGHVNPGDFGRLMVSLGIFYENAVLIPENNNHGWATIEAIKAEKYPHLLKTTLLWKEEVEKDGFPTNDRTRTQVITALRNANDDDTVYINDIQTLSEMETFVQNERTGKFEAQKGCHDDCVISLAIGVYCLKFLTVDETYGAHVRKPHGSPLVVSSFTADPKPVGGGHRRRTGY